MTINYQSYLCIVIPHRNVHGNYNELFIVISVKKNLPAYSWSPSFGVQLVSGLEHGVSRFQRPRWSVSRASSLLSLEENELRRLAEVGNMEWKWMDSAYVPLVIFFENHRPYSYRYHYQFLYIYIHKHSSDAIIVISVASKIKFLSIQQYRFSVFSFSRETSWSDFM